MICQYLGLSFVDRTAFGRAYLFLTPERKPEISFLQRKSRPCLPAQVMITDAKIMHANVLPDRFAILLHDDIQCPHEDRIVAKRMQGAMHRKGGMIDVPKCLADRSFYVPVLIRFFGRMVTSLICDLHVIALSVQILFLDLQAAPHRSGKSAPSQSEADQMPPRRLAHSASAQRPSKSWR